MAPLACDSMDSRNNSMSLADKLPEKCSPVTCNAVAHDFVSTHAGSRIVVVVVVVLGLSWTEISHTMAALSSLPSNDVAVADVAEDAVAVVSWASTVPLAPPVAR